MWLLSSVIIKSSNWKPPLSPILTKYVALFSESPFDGPPYLPLWGDILYGWSLRTNSTLHCMVGYFPKFNNKKCQYLSSEVLLSLPFVLQELWCNGLQMSKISNDFYCFFRYKAVKAQCRKWSTNMGLKASRTYVQLKRLKRYIHM